MTYLGIDTAARITAAQAAALKENGVSFVGRYLVPQTNAKSITAEEVKTLREAGLAILLCWELGAEAMRGGATQGAYDASRARWMAESLGVPSGTCIYFAADYNVPDTDLTMCEQYIKSAQAALGAVYEAGAYGPLKLVEFLHNRGACRKFWQCVAWSAYFSEHATVCQYQWQGGPEAVAMANATGILAVDMNRTDDLRRAGLWMTSYTEYQDGDGVILEPSKPVQKPTMWYDEAMAWAKEAKLINDGRPTDNLTRAEIATILQRYDKRMDEKISALEHSVDAKIVEAVKRRLPDDDSFGGLIG